MMPFDKAVAMILSEAPEQTEPPEPPIEAKSAPSSATKPEAKPAPKPQTKAAPAAPPPPAPKTAPQASTPQPELDFKSLYEESKDRALKLEAELEAYKRMCFHLIDTFRK